MAKVNTDLNSITKARNQRDVVRKPELKHLHAIFYLEAFLKGFVMLGFTDDFFHEGLVYFILLYNQSDS